MTGGCSTWHCLTNMNLSRWRYTTTNSSWSEHPGDSRGLTLDINLAPGDRWFGVPSMEVPPKWMVYTREYAIKMDDWSVPPSGNLHLNEMVFHLNTKRNDKSQGLHLNWDEVLPSLDSFVHTLFYWCLVGNGGTIQSRTITIWLFNIAMEITTFNR